MRHVVSVLIIATAANAKKPCGIDGVTRGPADLSVPPNVARGEVWRYGLGTAYQLDPTTAGLIVNIRFDGSPYGDFEVGDDLHLFDDVSKIDARPPIPLSRATRMVNPNTSKPCIMVKFPIIGGFVPLGAKRPDGSPHPHAGTGFGIAQAESYPADFRERYVRDHTTYHFREDYQFAYDGKAFRTVSKRDRRSWKTPDGWAIMAPGLTPAIPDGDDLLFAISCLKDPNELKRFGRHRLVAGMARFRCEEGQWRPVSFVPVTDPNTRWFEPSLIRDVDGSLLFSARGGRRGSYGDVPLWRSTDGGRIWRQMFYLKQARSGAPICLNQAADGSPYVATNQPGNDRRILCLYPVSADRTKLLAPIVARDSHAEFGPPPGSDRWKVDHPIGATLRLGDGKWHGIVVYRILDQGENYGKPPTPHTGCYVEQIRSRGPVLAPWRF